MDQPVELVVEHVADGGLQRQPLLVGPAGVRPLDPLGHLEPGGPALGVDLEAGRGEEPAGVAPACAVIAAEGDLGRRARRGTRRRSSRSPGPSPASDGRTTQPDPLNRDGRRLDQEAAPVEQVASRVDQERGGGDLGRRAGQRVTIEAEEAESPRISRGGPSVVASSSLRRKVAG